METENLFFDPDKYPHNTLKEFKIFCNRFDLRYEAQFPDPPRSAMDSAIQRWELQNPPTDANPRPRPTIQQYDDLKEEWKAKDKVRKILGMFSSNRLYSDWQTKETDENERRDATWDNFKTKMEEFYKPSENLTLNNFQFRSVTQLVNETFSSFCNRVAREAKTCNFKCKHADCSGEDIAIRDQVVIGTTNHKIREEALLKAWDLPTLRVEGMKLESATKGEAEISGGAINKIGKYSFSNIRRNHKPETPSYSTNCYNCNEPFKGPAFKHKERCKAKNHSCKSCHKIGHFENMCRKPKDIKYHEAENLNDDETETNVAISNDIYNLNIFKVELTKNSEYKQMVNNHEFNVEVVVNGSLTSVTADTGAKVSVTGKHQAIQWNLMSKITPTNVRIKPYNSPPVDAIGKARCAVTFGETSIPVEWYILDGKCEPILSGNAAVNLGIIQFTKNPPVYKPIKMVDSDIRENNKEQIQNILVDYPDVFTTKLGKHKSYQVKLHIDPTVKPIVTPCRPTPYHLVGRIDKVLEQMIKDDVIEEHPVGEPTPWISNAVTVPKPNGSLRLTLDARNINKAIISSNLPIPKQEDIRANLAGSCVFSKLDFRSAFWQLELHPDSRNLTVFSMNNKLYRYKRLTMGVKPAQGELNAALIPMFSHISDAHVIHDDCIVASKDMTQHLEALDKVFQAIRKSGMTLNHEKCEFGKNEIKFWGMIINAEGVKPDPEKVEALDGLKPPNTKDELTSFLCMMQSNSEFIPSFSRKAAPLRELINNKSKFKWEDKHQKCFEQLLSEFHKDTSLRYFDISKPTYLFTDAHISGLGAILAQGDTVETAKPVAIASRATTDAEKRYPQIDLEGLSVDYGLYRFRNYLVGSPTPTTVVTDHMPLCAIFNGNKIGSIRTERFKQRNQDLRFKVVYQKGKKNQSDYISRKTNPMKKLSKEDEKRSESINNLLYTLHTTPIIDKITLKTIAEETSKDETLKELRELITKGQTWIPKNSKAALLKFNNILSEITTTGNGILLKGDRIILPDSLQETAIKLAHQGSHPGQSSMERRLRYHFFFHMMNVKVKEILSNCTECNIFLDKKCNEPIKSHEVPEKCWEKVATDLFGPLPSRNHIVVVQDMASRFPTARIVSSTSASAVLPALNEIYNAYGNPEKQLSDNGPPFNSSAMDKFAKDRNIELEKIPPLHPSANPAETFMKPLSKTMKIANYNNESEKAALQHLLQNYRDTPHPATGIPPAAMFFRDSLNSAFPRKAVKDDTIKDARLHDELKKTDREENVNNSKYKKYSQITIGDPVLVRNFRRTSKFHPTFLPEQYTVTSIWDHGRKLEVERVDDGQTLIRHPDDLKRYYLPHQPVVPHQAVKKPDFWEIIDSSPYDMSSSDPYTASYPYVNPNEAPFQNDGVNQQLVPNDNIVAPENLLQNPNNQHEPRRSERVRGNPDRLGSYVYNADQPLDGEDEVIQPWWPGYPRTED